MRIVAEMSQGSSFYMYNSHGQEHLKYQRINVILSWFYISQSTGEQFVSSYFIYNENNALVHSIDFERSIQNEKEEMYI